MSRLELAQIQGRVAFLVANNATFDSVDVVVATVAGECMVEAIRDRTNIKTSVIAWRNARNARNALALNADAPLPPVEA